MNELQRTLAHLTSRYCEVHTRKEDLAWVAKMGLSSAPREARQEMADAEKAFNAFLQDPDRISRLRALAQSHDGPDDETRDLQGWIAMLGAHVIESPEGRRISDEIVERESELARRRAELDLAIVDPDTGARNPASSNRLRLVMRTDPSEARRRAAHHAMRSIERFVLDSGFLDIVKARNRLARIMGHEDFYAWRVAVVEGMDKKRLFSLLEDLERRTAARARKELAALADEHGEGALDPWNFGYLRGGKLTEALDPYFSFGSALGRWMRSFHALGIRYRGATLTLDLVERPGKYENGFMHGPEPAFFDQGTWRPARINFAANAVVGQVGSGYRTAETLFHEGGHAAHFSNILTGAPCFSQELAPTSIALAETQSMFLDSLLGDADWRLRYATDADGRPIPQALTEEAIADELPYKGWEQRALLTIPFAERALYELADDELTADRVLSELRGVESRLQGLSSGMRPVLSVPHLLSSDASAYYHGYVLAEMAVHQTRAHFLERDGHLTDNPRIGPDLARHYWAPGNGATFEKTLRSLTGRGLSADALVTRCNQSVDDAIAHARTSVERMKPEPAGLGAVELDASIRVMHGREMVAATDDLGYEGSAAAFADWIEELEGRPRRSP